MSARRSLRNRILVVMSSLALAISLVYALHAAMFVYVVEDAFLDAHLADEAAWLQRQHAATQRWPAPRDPAITLHRSVDDMPPAVRDVLRDEPRRREFPGDHGSHFHLSRLDTGDGGDAWLLYDAGSRLVVRRMRGTMLQIVVGTAVVFVALALGIGFWAVRRTTARLESLAETVAALDPAHPPAAWPLADRGDEVGIVAGGLATMTTRLRAFVDRERRFTRDASHELRTPLAVIRSAGDQLAQRDDLSPAARQHAELIRGSTARLEMTVAALLALARETPVHDAGQGVALLPLVERTVVEQSPRLVGRPITVEVDVPATARLPAPESVVNIVLANLIGNAFAHAGDGMIRIDVDGDALRIANPLPDDARVDDGGTFVRARDGDEGFGFGLGIVTRIAERFALAFSLRVEEGRVVARIGPAARHVAGG